MTDTVIPDAPEKVIAAIDMTAERFGLSRDDHLRRSRLGTALQEVEVSVAAQAGSAEPISDDE